ncbi:hypothetical protein [Kaistella montana]|uniref:Glycosyltransferase RgtA/B/C/D-like domain-containing protein n=1 Tax=Kaistella montana TaxID=1849733 RepID=A0ABW5K8W8_9FLAO|nr:hypothetical protein [Kaistella montana]MCQ4035669.1 hypothetical protein [Kaistella montana]
MNIKYIVSYLFLFVLGVLTFSCYQNRVYDWDMPGYLGSIYTWDYPKNPEYVHELVYSSIKKEASPEEYHDIIAYNEANKVFEKNYKAFSEQLPYYQIKIGYNTVVYFFYKLGVSGPHAVFLLNIFSFFFCGVLLFYLFRYFFPKNQLLAAFLSLFLMWFPAVRSMAENPTPDIFLLVFMLLFVINVIQNRNQVWRYIFLLCCVLIRPDFILFALTYLFVAFVYDYLKQDKKIGFHFVVQGFLLIMIYFFIIKFYHYPGWKDVFYDTFIYRRPIISAQKAEFTFAEYRDFIILKLINFKKVTLISLFLLGAIFYFSKDLWIRIFATLIFVNIYIKFIFFPQGGTLRFFIGFVMILFIVFLYAMSKKSEENKLKKIA